jgi:hypothetical protein
MNVTGERKGKRGRETEQKQSGKKRKSEKNSVISKESNFLGKSKIDAFHSPRSL